MLKILLEFFNSGAFVGLVALVGASGAFIIYFRQKRDIKRDAANTILLEVQNAERQLKNVKDSVDKGTLPSDVYSMPNDSWGRYKYLFVRNFDRDEWDSLSDFYAKCILYDEAVRFQSTLIPAASTAIGENIQKSILEYVKSNADESNGNAPDSYQELTRFIDRYLKLQGNLAYLPKKPVLDAQDQLRKLNLDLSQTAVGTKLKKLSKNSFF